ncbi:hypothetical protein IQ07DRAFT_183129 [Pyrenochaeta sp. DS3sAY3a]|nr:hypothetical protein IQ07DRAFT_183129 [Pyrenochaeta sp. DS3sAY3a]
MICRNCLRAASRTQARTSTPARPQIQRFLSTSRVLRNAAPAVSSSSNSAAPSTPGSGAAASAKPAEKKPSGMIKSSVPAGQPLKGLNFLKNAQDPVALPDDEYPAWLWTVLDRQEKKAEGGAAGDLFSKSKKQRRLAAKRLRKEQAMNPELLVPKVPLYEQTIDLPAGDGSIQGAVQAADARDGLTKAMRVKRRATIKEANFLKAMG